MSTRKQSAKSSLPLTITIPPKMGSSFGRPIPWEYLCYNRMSTFGHKITMISNFLLFSIFAYIVIL